MEEFFHHFKRKNFPKNATLITFDDGFRDNFKTVLPIIEEYKVPISLFITTGFINRTNLPYELAISETIEKFKDDVMKKCYSITKKKTKNKHDMYIALTKKIKFMEEPYKSYIISKIIGDGISYKKLSNNFLTWNDIFLLKNSPFTSFGSHLVSHTPLTTIPINECAKELNNSKVVIEKKLNCVINALSYPYGDYNQSVKKEVEKAGYSLGFTTEEKKIHCRKSDCYLLPRFSQNAMIN